ncbi:prolyl oligopeptidase family serine peptidase [Terrimonas sp. NA20]|uniref:Prolyl oligopeptidase family serine peptidase n=1 Tax=Terrimonas ginsenosidimutans TaxID=2908004 RepID=A0ABS9KYH8_9BACT|nr:prolyl oligopeptidase family serine peptidase [Terrimonas ginsenosidimutans]MCG2617389.1 prolyl oligopeptidase family serine peptidase [Terrimonas ginsenosidimutans]
MIRTTLFLLFLLPVHFALAQKKPLDHTVYDGWQNIGQRSISNDGKWVVYNVNVQEGDNELVIQSADASYRKTIARGADATITEDNRFVIFRISAPFKEAREARIKKKKADESPKDSLAILELGKDSIWKMARVKSFKTPDKASGWLAYHLEKAIEAPSRNARPAGNEKRITDSLTHVIDSLKNVISAMPKKKSNKDDDFSEEFLMTDADGDEVTPSSADAGSDLVVRNLKNNEQKTFRFILEYQFNEKGTKLVMEQARNPKDSTSKPHVLLYDLTRNKLDTIATSGNDFKNFALSDDGEQLAFLAERDAKPKDLQKFYKLWYYKSGMDSAVVLVDKATAGIKSGFTVSEYGAVSFSNSGKRLFFATAPIAPPKDTTLVEMDLVKLDVWHYKDDYLQTVQLSRLQRDLQQNYMAVYDLASKKVNQLATEEIPTVFQSGQGDGDVFVGTSDVGRRIESQWTGGTVKDVYAINPADGSRKLIKKEFDGSLTPAYVSPTGKTIVWYDNKTRHYFAYDGDSTRNITAKIKTSLANEENDSPTDPSPYGIMRWHKDESAIYIYDRYSVWKVSPKNAFAPTILIGGRSTRTNYRYQQVDRDERAIEDGQTMLFRTFSDLTKKAGLWEYKIENGKYKLLALSKDSTVSIGQVAKAKEASAYVFSKESYTNSPDLYTVVDYGAAKKLSSINPQQASYNWGTAELYKWKTFLGKTSEGILYKPENFDSTKKYPVLFYFYEKLSDGLYGYQAPSPTPSRLNISFFVSRGYLVFAPDISYTIGHPAKSAYDYIVSVAKDLSRHKWVDSKNMGIQGQSWGGIQVAQLVTMTDMFKAAWAGAPVANMTSAYGGIRWESGSNRQFQYERTQSRIGATLWEKPELYIESSPLFHLPKVKTPLVIMANDADGAVPWYQGIELFTGMRRLGKQVWMLNYNGEAHNLVQRKNRKDIQIREQQYFDWLLKGDKPAKWIVEGVPAVKKGKDWGLDVVN